MLTPNQPRLQLRGIASALGWTRIFKGDSHALKLPLSQATRLQFLGSRRHPPRKKKRTLTTLDHPYFVALAKAAGLAAFAPVLVYGALVGGWADVIVMSYSKNMENERNGLVGNTDNTSCSGKTGKTRKSTQISHGEEDIWVPSGMEDQIQGLMHARQVLYH